MKISEAAKIVADRAFNNNREPEQEFLSILKKRKDDDEVYTLISTLEFDERMRLLSRAEREYGSV